MNLNDLAKALCGLSATGQFSVSMAYTAVANERCLWPIAARLAHACTERHTTPSAFITSPWLYAV